MKLSIIIPAYNEETELPLSLPTVHEAMKQLTRERDDLEWELIVTDNNSSDATSDIAKKLGAVVVFEPVNQIARARNAGAAHATGDWFLFIDADSRLHVDSVRDLLDAIASGDVGAGGCLVRMDEAPYWGRCGIQFWNILSRTLKWAAGSFVFCRADGFRETGGFDEQFYAAEELHFSASIKRWCRNNKLQFTVLTRQAHESSARKFQIYTKREIFTLFRRVFFSYGSTVRNQSALDFFYDGRR